MAFENNSEYPIEFWINEVVEIVAKVEGIPKKSARLRKDECLGDYIAYYEAGLKPQNAVDALWMADKKGSNV